tara:strand:- start:1061 stop:1345 length:285 start_codon:yes stop_codon:yes gene_type:complete
MTEEKKKEKTPIELSKEEQEELAKNLDRLASQSGRTFLNRCKGIFFGTIYVLAMSIAGFVLSIVAAIFLPFFLPFSYLRGLKKGEDPLRKILEK